MINIVRIIISVNTNAFKKRRLICFIKKLLRDSSPGKNVGSGYVKHINIFTFL